MITDEQIRQLVARELDVSPELLKPETVLTSLPDFDSVELVMMIVALDEAGIKISSSEAANLRTFGDILSFPRK